MSSSRILVIEDDTDIRNTLQEVLEFSGYSVSVASHGREGLERLEQGLRPSLILLDLMMPVMNGWEFLEARRGKSEIDSIPVVILSAVRNLDKESALKGLAFIPKPIDIDALLGAIEKHLGSRQE